MFDLKHILHSCILTAIAFSLAACVQAGGEPVQVSQDGYNYYPVLSPDGRYVAYLHAVDETLGAEGTIWVFDRESGDRWRVNDEIRMLATYDSDVSWSRDSKGFIFLGDGRSIRHYDVQQRLIRSIGILNADSTDSRALTTPSYSCGGGLIAINTSTNIGDEAATQIVVFDRVDSSVIYLPPVAYITWGEVLSHRPQWTSDDTRIIGTFCPGSVLPQRRVVELRSFDVMTGESVVLTESQYGITYQVLDSMVYYIKAVKDSHVLFENSVLGGKERLLFENLDWYSFGVVHENGKATVYFSRNDSLLTWRGDGTKPMGIRGRSPSVQQNMLFYQVYDHNEEAENDGRDDTFSDNIIWMVKLD